MNQGEPGSEHHDDSTPWDDQEAGETTHAAHSLPDSQGDSEEESPEEQAQAAEQPAGRLTTGNRAQTAGKGGAHALSSIHPPSGSKQGPRKRGNRKPELVDVLTQKQMREDVAALRATIQAGSHKERIEAFRLLYGSAGDARRGPEPGAKPSRKRPGIVLPDV